MKQPLTGVKVITLAANLPGPLAALELAKLGAEVTKVEAPSGDPMEQYHAGWYQELKAGQKVIRLDLKKPEDRAELDHLLSQSHLLITASRPAALARLGLDWDSLQAKFPKLSQVAITGHPLPHENLPGHDITYQAEAGLIQPPHMPVSLLADLMGGAKAVSAALSLLYQATQSGHGGLAYVSLVEAAAELNAPIRFKLTTPGAYLGGGDAVYGLYETREGWVALAALEPAFQERLRSALGLTAITREALDRAFLERTAKDWESWAHEHDIPLAATRKL